MILIDHIEKSYGTQPALKGVSLSVNEGELFGLIGPDGAGKSSLMRILVTLILPDKGNAMIDGLDVVADYRKIRKIVGYMPGRFSLYHDLSVEENLQFFATVFGTTVEKNYALIKDIYGQIEPFRKRPAGKLSGGMKQKLALSCALIHAPKVLILDEPTTGVDAVSRKEFWEMLKNLKKMGITILVSTPYMDEAMMCDRVALVQEGRVMSVDTPSGVTAHFKKKLLAVDAGNTSERYACINLIRKMTGIESVFAFGDSLHVCCDDTVTVDDLIVYLNNNRFGNHAVNEIKPGIEDVFMELMQHHDN